MSWVTIAFVVDGGLAMIAFLFQWIAIINGSKDVRDHSLAAWCYWTLSTAVGSLYAIIEVKVSVPLIAVVVGLFLGNVVTVILIAYMRLTNRAQSKTLRIGHSPIRKGVRQ